MRKTLKRGLFALLVAALALGLFGNMAAALPGKPGESPEDRAKRLAWWEDARFGMFIHWGVYSKFAGSYNGKPAARYGEWIENNSRIPAKDYEAMAAQWNPEKFDADKWVQIAKDAGMKYIVITAKHHDGFSMFDSKVTDYNIVGYTPFKRDPIKELAAACAKAGLRFGVYYSQNLDWHEADSGHNNWDFDPAKADYEKYFDGKAMPQVRELLTNYGPIAELWFDMPANESQADGDKIRALAWQIQPNIIINDRGGGKGGDFNTPEQTVPGGAAKGSAVEACMTLNDTWGYRSDDHNWKSPKTMLRNLINCASNGANYLVNVGPEPTGELTPETISILSTMGAWMKTNGDSIYGTTESPVGVVPWGRVTGKPGKLYLNVYDWPADGKLFVPACAQFKSATLLADPSRQVGVSVTPDGLDLTLSGAAPDPISSVIEVDYEGVLTYGTPRGNAAVNADFSRDPFPDGWQALGKKIERVTGTASEPVSAVAITYTPGDKSHLQLVEQRLRVPPTGTASFSVDVKTEGADAIQGMIELFFFDENGKQLSQKQSGFTSGTHPYQKLALNDVAIPAGAVSAAIKGTVLRKGEVKMTQSIIFTDFQLSFPTEGK